MWGFFCFFAFVKTIHSHVNCVRSLWPVPGVIFLSVLYAPIPFCVVFLLVLWCSGTTSSDCVSAKKFPFGETQSNLQCTRRCLSNIDEFTHQGLASEAVHIWGYANAEKVSPRSSPVLRMGCLQRRRNPEFEVLSAKVVWALSLRPLLAPCPLPPWLLESKKWRATGWGRT